MKTYFEAYHERMERNEGFIFDFAKELNKHGFATFFTCDTNRFLSHLIITKGNKHVRLDFGEVPYRWCLHINWKPNTKTGSGRTVLEKYNLDKVDFTIDEIEKHLYPNYEPIEKMYNWTKLIDISKHPRFKF